jgi:hypothetical protein
MTDELLLITDELERRARGDRYCPHAPTIRQKEFLDLQCLEALYGGAAGGGKSDALLMAALQYAHVPGYSALLLRRTYADLALPEAIMDRSKAWLMGSGAQWNDRDKRWTFPSGATLTFGYLDNDRDRYRYQSAAFQFIGWDELTQFPKGWYLYLFSRLRRLEKHDVPLRMRGASNPGGIGHEWVKARFVDEPEDRVFVPAKMSDNPHLDQMSYMRSLEQLDPVTRAQLLEGRWLRDSGGLVYLWEPSHNGLPTGEGSMGGRTVLGIDFGYTDSTAFCVLGWPQHSKTVTVLESSKATGMIPSACAERVKELDAVYHFDRIVGDVGGLGKGYAEEMRQRYGIPVEPAEKRNKLGYIALINGAFSRGELLVVKPRNQDLIRELEELPWNEERSAEEPGFENHLTDALLYGWRAAMAWAEEAAEEPEENEQDRMRAAIVERWQARKDAPDWLQGRFRR